KHAHQISHFCQLQTRRRAQHGGGSNRFARSLCYQQSCAGYVRSSTATGFPATATAHPATETTSYRYERFRIGGDFCYQSGAEGRRPMKVRNNPAKLCFVVVAHFLLCASECWAQQAVTTDTKRTERPGRSIPGRVTNSAGE